MYILGWSSNIHKKLNEDILEVLVAKFVRYYEKMCGAKYGYYMTMLTGVTLELKMTIFSLKIEKSY